MQGNLCRKRGYLTRTYIPITFDLRLEDGDDWLDDGDDMDSQKNSVWYA